MTRLQLRSRRYANTSLSIGMPATIRRFDEHEWPIYRDLRLRALADSPDAFGSSYDLEAARGDGEWEARLRDGVRDQHQCPLVAFMKNAPVGLAWARRDAHEHTLAHLFQVWVAPTYRGQQIGRQLTAAVIAWARQVGVNNIRLGVTPSHPAATRLYRRAGFVDAGPAEALRPGSRVRCQPMQLTLDTVDLEPLA